MNQIVSGLEITSIIYLLLYLVFFIDQIEEKGSVSFFLFQLTLIIPNTGSQDNSKVDFLVYMMTDS